MGKYRGFSGAGMNTNKNMNKHSVENTNRLVNKQKNVSRQQQTISNDTDKHTKNNL